MEILVLGFIAVAAFVGLANKDLVQVVLAGAWVGMALCATGAVLWSIGSFILHP
jgi:hypothetical protein